MRVPSLPPPMKLIEALTVNRGATESSGARPYLLACGFTPLHLSTFFEAHLHTRLPSRAIEVRTGLFGDVAGTLEAAADELEGIALVIEWEDLDPRLGLRRLGGWSDASAGDLVDGVERSLARLEGSLERIAVPVALVSPTLPLPPIDTVHGGRAGPLTADLRARIAEWQARLSRLPSVRLADPSVVGPPPGGRIRDVDTAIAAGFPYHREHAERIAAVLAALLHPPRPKKGLITDLDDTLWKGILGEVGVDGVHWDLDHGAQPHGLYQQLLAALADRGILIGVASKNDAGLVDRALERDLLIGRDSLFPVEANWGPKSESVTRILEAWNIGPDAVVFVDDSPMELAEVQAVHPEVECLAFPTSSADEVMSLLETLRDRFWAERVTDEDRLRIDSLRAGGALRAAAASGDRLDTFLEGLEAKIELERTTAGDERAFQLVNKTNQFNANGRRLSEAEWARLHEDPERVSWAVTYRDRFGPLGKIAVLIGKRTPRGVEIDTWVMSCRAFARRIEHACLARLFATTGVETVTVAYARTERNGPVRTFLSEASGDDEAEVGGPVTIDAAEFAQRCPPLYHEIEEVENAGHR